MGANNSASNDIFNFSYDINLDNRSKQKCIEKEVKMIAKNLHARAVRNVQSREPYIVSRLKSKTGKSRREAWSWVAECLYLSVEVPKNVWAVLFEEYSRPHRLGKDLDMKALEKILHELSGARLQLMRELKKHTAKSPLLSSEALLPRLDEHIGDISLFYKKDRLELFCTDLGGVDGFILKQEWMENAEVILFEDVHLHFSANVSKFFEEITASYLS